MDAKRVCAVDCGAKCCRGAEMVLRDDEYQTLKALAEERGIDFNPSPSLTGEGYVLDMHGACPFLEGNLCGAYEVRPFACRAYPEHEKSGCILSGWQERPQVFVAVPRGGRHVEAWHVSFEGMLR